MKVVINSAYGGFSLSRKAVEYIADKGDEKAKKCLESLDTEYRRINSIYVFSSDEDRTNPLLIEAVETLGREADGTFANLKVVEIPDDIDWEITEYDGWETVEEKHRSWS